jgi:hypothetical protein
MALDLNIAPLLCSIFIWWDNLKYQIKRYSKLFSSNLAKEKRKDFFYIQNKIQKLCDAQARGIVIDVTKLENWKLEHLKYYQYHLQLHHFY